MRMREYQKQVNHRVLNINGPKFGIELEVEGSNLPDTAFGKGYWRAEPDGSLRGRPMSMEYVSKPLSLSGLSAAIEALKESFKDNDSTIIPSFRTSTHIHVNVQDMCVTQLANFVSTYLLLEGSLYSICGKSRKGNNFCIPLNDCDNIIDKFTNFCSNPNVDTFSELNSDGDKYSALSLRPISMFGTVEVRTHEGVDENQLDRVLNWVTIFDKVRKYAVESKSPASIIIDASSMGAYDFITKFTGDIKVDVDIDSFWKGVSSIQSFVSYCDWVKEPTIAEEYAKESKDFRPSSKRATTTQEPELTTVAMPASLLDNLTPDNPFYVEARQRLRPMIDPDIPLFTLPTPAQEIRLMEEVFEEDIEQHNRDQIQYDEEY